MVAVPPDLEAQLTPLAQQRGCSPAALSRAVAGEDKVRQAGMVQHGAAVASWLRDQGVSDAQLQRLLLRCPLLFSWPVEQRAGVLFGQLQCLGLSAAEAARCFERQPVAAGSPSFAPAIGVLAELFAAGSKSSDPAEQLQELGGGRELYAKLLRRAPGVAASSMETVFGQQATLNMVGKAPQLLTIDSSVWQTALAVTQLCGLTEQQAMEVASNNALVLCCNWLAVGPLANRLALQRCLQLTAGQVYLRHAGYATFSSAERLAGRLLFLQQHGLLHLLVAGKDKVVQQRRRQHGFRAAGEQPLISLGDVSTLSDIRYASLPAVQAAGGLPALQAFTAGLESNPAWVELQAAAAQEGAQLLAQLPPWLQLQWQARPGALQQRRRMAVA
ncbi:hypothetical protein ABPG77_009846 [Micractinium sp. CCAP 211/92]